MGRGHKEITFFWRVLEVLGMHREPSVQVLHDQEESHTIKVHFSSTLSAIFDEAFRPLFTVLSYLGQCPGRTGI